MSYALIRNLARQSNLDWVVIGDFNELLNPFEKKGFHLHPKRLTRQFQNVLGGCSLKDLGCVGQQYTWEKWQGQYNWVKERLDRVIASSSWVGIFSKAKLYHLSETFLNYFSIYLKLKFVNVSHKIGFDFENCWSRKAECGHIIQKCQERNSNLLIQENLERYDMVLDEWGRSQLRELRGKIFTQKKRINYLKGRRDGSSIQALGEVEAELFCLLQ